MKLTFWNGVDTVGGVQVLASGTGGSIIFDLGVVRNPHIAPRRSLFNDFIRPRNTSVLADYLRAGMAPRVEGLFAASPAEDPSDPAVRYPSLTFDLPLASSESVGELAVFVSHLHDDHMALLPFVSQEIPVYMSAVSVDLHGALVAADEIDPCAASISGLAPGETFGVGDLEIELVPIDHDIVGSSGIIVRSSDGVIAYTGDWRRHGSSPELLDGFAERCREVGIDALLTEGSMASPSPRSYISEGDFVEQLEKLVTGTPDGLIAIGFYRRHLERVMAIASISERATRRLAVTAETAVLLTEAAEAGIIDTDTLTQFVVYTKASPHHSIPEVTIDEIASAREAFVLEMEPSLWPLLLDLNAGAEDLYVQANGAPFGRNDPNWIVLETWLGQLGISHEDLDSHGHASPEDLEWLVDATAPGCVIPVHTNHPTHFPAGRHRVVLPERGGEIEVRS